MIPQRESMMSETPPETPAPPADPAAATEAAPAAPTPEPPKPTETVEYWKQRARDNENRAKANATAAEKLKEIEDRDLSELDRAKRTAEEATARLADLEATTLRQRIALEKSLPADIAATLSGTTAEELTAHADRLLAWRGNVPPAAPIPDPSQGNHATSEQAQADAEYAAFFPTDTRS